MRDHRSPYFERLTSSPLPRYYWSGAAPDDPKETWHFETVMDGRKHVAIRQLTITADGEHHAYSATHLEDDWGFLTDQPVEPEKLEGLNATTQASFEAAWNE
jgi:hypothetical protein